MKFSIDVDESAVRAAIKGQMDAAIAAITEEEVSKAIREIFSVKLDRLTTEALDAAFAKAAEEHLRKHLGDSVHSRHQATTRLIGDAATRVIKQNLNPAV